jgi:hypothetical protein
MRPPRRRPLRVESSLAVGVSGLAQVNPTSASAAKAKRIFQLRTYESPSNGDHVRKVEMFHSGEFEIFLQGGLPSVFFGDTLIGSADAEPDVHAELCRPG